MGEVRVDLTVENVLEPGRRIACRAMVDTGAYGLILPMAWKERLGDLPELSTVDLELGDGRVVTAEIRGPARIWLGGFRRVIGEVIFVDMEPRPDGSYEPLVGYTVLDACNVMVDVRRRRLVARRFYSLKGVRAA
jgi:predicted aspartyl protease